MKKEIVSEAESWIGTSFHHQGRVKLTDSHYGGCDCIGLVLGVAKSLNLKSKFAKDKCLTEFDNLNYKRVVKGNELKEVLVKHLEEIDILAMDICDVVLFNINRNLQHVGLIVDNKPQGFYIIHAYIQARKVVKHYLDQQWIDRIDSVYRFADLI